MRVMTENPMGRQRSGWRYKLYRAGRGFNEIGGLYLLLLPAVVLLFLLQLLAHVRRANCVQGFSPSQEFREALGGTCEFSKIL